MKIYNSLPPGVMPSAKARGIIDLPYAGIEVDPTVGAPNWCVDYEDSMLVCHAGAYDVAMRADYFRNKTTWFKQLTPNTRLALFSHVVFDRSQLRVPTASMAGRLRYMADPSYQLSVDFHRNARTFEAIDDFIIPCYVGPDTLASVFEAMLSVAILRARPYITRGKRIVLAVCPIADETLGPVAGMDTHIAHLEIVWAAAVREDCDIQIWASAGAGFVLRDRDAIAAGTPRPKQTPSDWITQAELEATDLWRWLQSKTSVSAPASTSPTSKG